MYFFRARSIGERYWEFLQASQKKKSQHFITWESKIELIAIFHKEMCITSQWPEESLHTVDPRHNTQRRLFFEPSPSIYYTNNLTDSYKVKWIIILATKEMQWMFSFSELPIIIIQIKINKTK